MIIKKIYRIGVTVHESGYVDVEANTESEARELVDEAIDNGEFFGNKSWVDVEEVIEVINK